MPAKTSPPHEPAPEERGVFKLIDHLIMAARLCFQSARPSRPLDVYGAVPSQIFVLNRERVLLQFSADAAHQSLFMSALDDVHQSAPSRAHPQALDEKTREDKRADEKSGEDKGTDE